MLSCHTPKPYRIRALSSSTRPTCAAVQIPFCALCSVSDPQISDAAHPRPKSQTSTSRSVQYMVTHRYMPLSR